MRLTWIPVLIVLAFLTMGSEHECTVEEEQDERPEVVEPAPTPVPTPTPTRCYEAPQQMVEQIRQGITLPGPVVVHRVFAVENNDGQPWHFVGASISAAGVDEVIGIWGSGPDLTIKPHLLATDHVSAEISKWDLSGGNARFADIFDDEIAAVRECAKGG